MFGIGYSVATNVAWAQLCLFVTTIYMIMQDFDPGQVKANVWIAATIVAWAQLCLFVTNLYDNVQFESGWTLAQPAVKQKRLHSSFYMDNFLCIFICYSYLRFPLRPFSILKGESQKTLNLKQHTAFVTPYYFI